jgi:toxin FitB
MSSTRSTRAAPIQTATSLSDVSGRHLRGVGGTSPQPDPPAAAVLHEWLDELRFVYSDRILPIDDAVATTWGRLMAQRTRPAVDALILATAHVNNKVIVTRNVAGFVDAGVEVIDPWAVMR